MDSHTVSEQVGFWVIVSVLGCSGIFLLCASFYVFKACEFVMGCCKCFGRCCRWCVTDTDGDIIKPTAYAEYELVCPL